MHNPDAMPEPAPCPVPRLLSVNVGAARLLRVGGRTVLSGIRKSPVDGPVAVGALGLAGDELTGLAKGLKAACGSGGTAKDGVVEIRNIVREAGTRAKIAVASLDANVEPLGAAGVKTAGDQYLRFVERGFGGLPGDLLVAVVAGAALAHHGELDAAHPQDGHHHQDQQDHNQRHAATVLRRACTRWPEIGRAHV